VITGEKYQIRETVGNHLCIQGRSVFEPVSSERDSFLIKWKIAKRIEEYRAIRRASNDYRSCTSSHETSGLTQPSFVCPIVRLLIDSK
jgi:hypothetical protein